jgi:hypothetical protein
MLNILVELKDGQFLSAENANELHQWLVEHFSENKTLSIDEARKYFGVGRQFVVRLLEFADRKMWTYRKNNQRVAFKLNTSYPIFDRLKHASADEKQSAPLLS